MIHWYTCIEFVIIACFAMLVFMVWWACRVAESNRAKGYKQGYAIGRNDGHHDWESRNGFKMDEASGRIDYQGWAYFRRPF